ncbi:DUF4328 domain-containing protein [Kitasatospora camelliae]|uniref:DUF4328 domain-containing protein n=1 Tax=Kitasatospora camelliae TaxID=3156397 RepID=A0AAU8K605_9ACTN
MPVMILVSALSLVVTVCWTRRCRLNAEAFAPGTHRYGPGLAVWGWLIPVGNLWIPRRVMLDVRRASGLTGPARLIEGWWWVRLVKLPVALAVGRIMPNPMVSLHVALISAVSGILLLLVIREITAAQAERLAA